MSVTRYLSEQERYYTFSNWPIDSPVTASDLAASGFYYLNHGDQVICNFCSTILSEWRAGDEPWTVHILWGSQRCRFFTGEKSGNIPLPQSREVVRQKATPHFRFAVLQQHSVPYGTYTDGSGTLSGQERVLLPTRAATNRVPPLNSLYDGFPDSHSKTPQDSTQKSSGAHNKQIDLRLLCKICFTNEVRTLFLPCRHLANCENCSKKLDTCSICRKIIGWKLNIFLS